MRTQIKIFVIVFYLVLSFSICIDMLTLRNSTVGIFFSFAVQICVVYEHGYKIFMKNQRSKILFLTVYIIPLIVALCICASNYV